jgi:hypothetical protein
MLTAANLLTGLKTGAVGSQVIGENYPAAKIDTAVIFPGWKSGALAGAIGLGANGTNDGLFLTLNGTVAGADDAGLKPTEALRIDTKLDDGDPSVGDTVAGGANCGTAAAGAVAGTYTTTATTDVCSLFVRIQG